MIKEIISKYQNKKIISLRKEIKDLRNQVVSLVVFIKDRQYMDKRNLDRANEIKSVCEAIGICEELKSSIVASDQLLNQIDKSITYNSNTESNEIQ